MTRCDWANAGPLEKKYHDREWGVPVHDDRLFFEFMVLEGAQAGLSWSTILKKRHGYRRAFDDFNPELIAAYSDEKVAELQRNPEIVRNKLKIESAVTNARAFLCIQQDFGSFDAYIWQFVEGRPRQNSWTCASDVPASTSESDRMSKSLRQKGFTFVGTTICYAFMQATGMVNDHTVDCFRHAQVKKLQRR
ncbi:MAG: DNA-3-methyladenine glycosylase I [Pseudomonadota bacterium]